MQQLFEFFYRFDIACNIFKRANSLVPNCFEAPNGERDAVGAFAFFYYPDANTERLLSLDIATHYNLSNAFLIRLFLTGVRYGFADLSLARDEFVSFMFGHSKTVFYNGYALGVSLRKRYLNA